MEDGKTFEFGMAFKDWTRVVWTFVMSFLAYAAAAGVFNFVPGEPFSWDTLKVGLLGALFSFIKNFALADQSGIK